MTAKSSVVEFIPSRVKEQHCTFTIMVKIQILKLTMLATDVMSAEKST